MSVKRIFPYFVIVCLVWALPGWGADPQAPVFQVTGVTVTVSEHEFAGGCPHTFVFTGRITVNRAGMVRYQWLRSDGATPPEATVTFAGAGTQEVTTSWRLGAAPRTYDDCWQSIRIIAPNARTSNRGLFSLRCIPVAVLPTYEISGAISAGPDGNKTIGRQVRVIVRHERETVASQTITLDAAGTGSYRFERPLAADRYHVTVEKVPYTGSSTLNVCFLGTTPSDRWVELSAAAPRAAGQDFLIRWSIGWNTAPCW
jgi:hypothetical protein